jgi:hypothetical protein
MAGADDKYIIMGGISKIGSRGGKGNGKLRRIQQGEEEYSSTGCKCSTWNDY